MKHRPSFSVVSALLGIAIGMATNTYAERPIDGIADNSFLIEEAYNQDPGIVQHIFTTQYGRDWHTRNWSLNLTQEWPVLSQRHQFSYSIPSSFTREGGSSADAIADILLNYRFQLLEEDDRFPAFAPRFSLILPTGSRNDGAGNGVVGFQWNLPVSKKLTPWLASHTNYSVTYFPGTRVPLEEEGEGGVLIRRLSPARSLVSYSFGQSAIIALSARFHLVLEWLGTFDEGLNDRGRKEQSFSAIISPGFRAAVINGENLQVVVGAAMPIGLTRSADDYGAFLYLSIEHDFLPQL